jgi:hypothetical protein
LNRVGIKVGPPRGPEPPKPVVRHRPSWSFLLGLDGCHALLTPGQSWSRASPTRRNSGSVEQPKVVGVALKDEGEDGPRASTLAREAYFVAFAGAVRKVASMPVMVTGGFHSVAGVVEALEGGDLVSSAWRGR